MLSLALLASQKVERAAVAVAQVLLRLSIYFAAKQPLLMMGFALSLLSFVCWCPICARVGAEGCSSLRFRLLGASLISPCRSAAGLVASVAGNFF